MRATLQVRSLLERYRGDVAFNFDSNGRSVWVMARFGKGTPPLTPSTGLRTGFDPSRRPSGFLRVNGIDYADLLRSSGRGDGIPLDDEQGENGNEEEDQNKG